MCETGLAPVSYRRALRSTPLLAAVYAPHSLLNKLGILKNKGNGPLLSNDQTRKYKRAVRGDVFSMSRGLGLPVEGVSNLSQWSGVMGPAGLGPEDDWLEKGAAFAHDRPDLLTETKSHIYKPVNVTNKNLVLGPRRGLPPNQPSPWFSKGSQSRKQNMAMSPLGHGSSNHCAGKCQQRFSIQGRLSVDSQLSTREEHRSVRIAIVCSHH
jgi:hypothetical protein